MKGKLMGTAVLVASIMTLTACGGSTGEATSTEATAAQTQDREVTQTPEEEIPEEPQESIDVSDSYWFHEDYEEYYYFSDDGQVRHMGDDGYIISEGTYEWLFTTGDVILNEHEYGAIYDTENMLLIDDDGTIVLNPIDDPFAGEGGFALAGTGWRYHDHTLVFMTDGRVVTDFLDLDYMEAWYDYEWDEDAGEGTIEYSNGPARMYYGTDGSLHVQMAGDNQYCTYTERPDLVSDGYIDEPVAPEDAHMGGYEDELYGVWISSEDDETNFEFEEDLTCWLETPDDYVMYVYAYDGETLYIYDYDTEENLMTGYIDSYDDLIINEMTGWFSYEKE